MRAVAINRLGGPGELTLVDLPDPAPAPGQAVVEVGAAGVNFMDTGVRRGMAWNEVPFPRVLGRGRGQGDRRR
jgi:NADPH2:quinone reductase